MASTVPPSLKRFCHLCEAQVIFTHVESEGELERYECPYALIGDEKHGIYLTAEQIVASEIPEEKDYKPEQYFNRHTERIQAEASADRERKPSSRPGFLPRWAHRGLELIGLGDLAGRLFAKSGDSPEEPESLPEKPDFSESRAGIESIGEEISQLPDPDDPDGDWLDDLLDDVT